MYIVFGSGFGGQFVRTVRETQNLMKIAVVRGEGKGEKGRWWSTSTGT